MKGTLLTLAGTLILTISVVACAQGSAGAPSTSAGAPASQPQVLSSQPSKPADGSVPAAKGSMPAQGDGMAKDGAAMKNDSGMGAGAPTKNDGGMSGGPSMQQSSSMQGGDSMKPDGSMPAGNGMSSGASVQQTGSDMMGVEGRFVDYSPEAFAKAIQNGRTVLFFNAPHSAGGMTADTDFKANLDKIPADVTVLSVDFDTATDLKAQYKAMDGLTFVQVDRGGSEVARWNGGRVSDLVANLK